MEEIRKRLAMATNKLTKMKFLWMGQDAQANLRILRVCIFPIATYGCEAWMLGKTNLKRINAFEMKCYRKILRISWTEHITNKSIRELQVEEQWLEDFLRRQNLKYFGHLKRSEGLGKIILEGRINGRRERGRSRRLWERPIEDTFNRPITKAGRWALGRICFWKVVKDVMSSRISS